MPGSSRDRPRTVATTKPPSRRSCSPAPEGPTVRAATAALAESPRAASRAASLAASMQRTCIATAVRAAAQTTRTTTSAAMARAASTVAKPPSPVRLSCSARG